MSNLTHLTPTKRWNRHPPVISVEAWSRNRRLGEVVTAPVFLYHRPPVRLPQPGSTNRPPHPPLAPPPLLPRSSPLSFSPDGTSWYKWLPHSHAGVEVGPALLYLVAPADQQFCTTTESRVTDTAPPALVAAQPQPSCAFNPIFMGCVIPSRQPEVHWLACYEIATARPLSGDTAVVGIQFQFIFDFDDERPSGRFHDVQHPSQPQSEASNGSFRSSISRHERRANPRHRGVGSYERTAASSILRCFVLRCTLRHGLTHPFDWQSGRHYQTPTSRGRHQLEGRQTFVSCQPALGHMTSAPRTGLLRQVDSGLPPIPQHNGSIDVDVT